EGARVLAAAERLGLSSLSSIRAGRSFLVEGDTTAGDMETLAATALADPVVESFRVRRLPAEAGGDGEQLLNVLFKPGVTDNVGLSTRDALRAAGWNVSAVATVRTYRLDGAARDGEV